MSQINVNLMADSQGGSVAPISSVMRNRLIDAGFTINQRGYVSGVALSSGSYGHDRFKGGASGGTYTFTQLSTGVPISITITAGSIMQVIEGANMPEGGTYVLSWTGTAQAKFNGGAFGASPLAVTGIVAGANTTIEFGTGTCSFPQLEKGTQASGFEYRQFGQELALCQRYFCKTFNITTTPVANTQNTGSLIGKGNCASDIEPFVNWQTPVELRTAPTVTLFAINNSVSAGNQWTNAAAVATSNARAGGIGLGTRIIQIDNTGIQSGSAGAQLYIQATASAEL